MSATAWFIIAIVGFSLSGIALIAAVIILIKLNIPGVIGELSGKTVAREIKAIRAANISTEARPSQPSQPAQAVPAAGPSTADRAAMAKLHASKRLDKTASGSLGKSTDLLPGNRATDILPENRATDVLNENRATEVLPDSQATEVLPQGTQTEVLIQPEVAESFPKSGETELLPEAQQTEVLTEPQPFEAVPVARQTEVLTEPQPFEAIPAARQTEVLSAAAEVDTPIETRSGTTVLTEPIEPASQGKTAVTFRVVRSEIRIHTDEEI